MLHLLLKNSRIIIIWGVLFAILAGGVSLFFPKYYAAESQVLLISRGYGGVDPYTQAKAGERIGENLAQVIKTADFYSKVMESTVSNFDHDRWLKLDERARRKAWGQDVRADVVNGSGLVLVTVYSKTKDDTLALAQAVTDTLVNRGWEYVGSDVTLKAVNSPLVSRLPARPNYILNVLLGFVVGVLLSSWWVARYKRGVFGRI